MSIKRILMCLILMLILTNRVLAVIYCPPVSAIQCSDSNNCQLSKPYANWQIVNEFIPDGQSLTSFNSAYLFDSNDADGVFGTAECFYSGPEHGYAEVMLHTKKNKAAFYPAKSTAWNPTLAPNYKYFYNCVANKIKSCGFIEASAKK